VDASIDQFGGEEEERLRHLEAEPLGGRKVDGKIECGWSLDRQVGRLGTFQNSYDVVHGRFIHTSLIGAVTHEGAAPDPENTRAH